MSEHLAALETIKVFLIDVAVRFGPRVLVALALVIAGVMVGRWAERITMRALARFHLQEPVRQLILKLVRVLVFGLFAIMALQNLGIQLLPLIAGLGVVGAGIALAMQGVLGNLMAGLSVIFTKPFAVGEYISIAGEEGQVQSIGLFATVLGHPDMSRVVIPNRKIDGEILHNYGRVRQLQVIINVAPSADLDAAMATVNEVLRNSPHVLKQPAPVTAIGNITSAAVEILVKPWATVEDYNDASNEVKKTVVEAFRKQGIMANPTLAPVVAMNSASAKS